MANQKLIDHGLKCGTTICIFCQAQKWMMMNIEKNTLRKLVIDYMIIATNL